MEIEPTAAPTLFTTLWLAAASLLGAAAPAAPAAQEANTPEVTGEIARIETLAQETAKPQEPDADGELNEAVQDLVRRQQSSQIYSLGPSATEPLVWTLEQMSNADLAYSTTHLPSHYLLQVAPIRLTMVLDGVLARDAKRFDLLCSRSDLAQEMPERMPEGGKQAYTKLVERAIAHEGVSSSLKLEFALYAYSNGVTSDAIREYVKQGRADWSAHFGRELRAGIVSKLIEETGELDTSSPLGSVRYATHVAPERFQDMVTHSNVKMREAAAKNLSTDSRLTSDARLQGALTLSGDSDSNVAHEARDALGEILRHSGEALSAEEMRRILNPNSTPVPLSSSECDSLIEPMMKAVVEIDSPAELEVLLRQIITGETNLPAERALDAVYSAPAHLPLRLAALRLAPDLPDLNLDYAVSNITSMMHSAGPSKGGAIGVRAIEFGGLTIDESRSLMDSKFIPGVSDEDRAFLLRWLGEQGDRGMYHVIRVIGTTPQASEPVRMLAQDGTASIRARLFAAYALMTDAAATEQDVALASQAINLAVASPADRDAIWTLLYEVDSNYEGIFASGRADEALIGAFTATSTPTHALPNVRLQSEWDALRPAARKQLMARVKELAPTPNHQRFFNIFGPLILAAYDTEILDRTGSDEAMMQILGRLMIHDEGATLAVAKKRGFDWGSLALDRFKQFTHLGPSLDALLQNSDPAWLEVVAMTALTSGDIKVIAKVRAHIDAVTSMKESLARLKALQSPK